MLSCGAAIFQEVQEELVGSGGSGRHTKAMQTTHDTRATVRAVVPDWRGQIVLLQDYRANTSTALCRGSRVSVDQITHHRVGEKPSAQGQHGPIGHELQQPVGREAIRGLPSSRSEDR